MLFPIPQIFSAPKKITERCKIAIIVSDYNRDITQELLYKCQETLFENGIREKYLDIYWVPGAFEIPLAAKRLIQKKKYHVIIALGVVIKGKTHHFDLVVTECARGLMQVMLETGAPIVNEVLPVYNKKDAKIRAGRNNKNRGIEAAMTALKLYHSRIYQNNK